MPRELAAAACGAAEGGWVPLVLWVHDKIQWGGGLCLSVGMRQAMCRALAAGQIETAHTCHRLYHAACCAPVQLEGGAVQLAGGPLQRAIADADVTIDAEHSNLQDRLALVDCELGEATPAELLLAGLDVAMMDAAEAGFTEAVWLSHHWGGKNDKKALEAASRAGQLGPLRAIFGWQPHAMRLEEATVAAAARGHVEVLRQCHKWQSHMWGGLDLNPALHEAAACNQLAAVRACRELGATDFAGAAQIALASDAGQRDTARLCCQLGFELAAQLCFEAGVEPSALLRQEKKLAQPAPAALDSLV